MFKIAMGGYLVVIGMTHEQIPVFIIGLVLIAIGFGHE